MAGAAGQIGYALLLPVRPRTRTAWYSHTRGQYLHVTRASPTSAAATGRSSRSTPQASHRHYHALVIVVWWWRRVEPEVTCELLEWVLRRRFGGLDLTEFSFCGREV